VASGSHSSVLLLRAGRRTFIAHCGHALPRKGGSKDETDKSLAEAWRLHQFKRLLRIAHDHGLKLSERSAEVLGFIADANENNDLRFQDSGRFLQFPAVRESMTSLGELRSNIAGIVK
jgi:hypothetical protein